MLLGAGMDLAAEEAPALPTLAHSVAQLAEAQAQLQSASAVANLAMPGAFADMLIVRRTIAADWQRRLEAKTVPVDDAGLLRFTGELQALVASLQQLTNLAQQLGDAPRRFPHCLSEPAFTRYRALVSVALDQGLQAVVAGRLRDQVAPAAWFRRQARHTTLLHLIEAGHLADERYALLPRDDRWLVEYREHLLVARTTLEHRLEQLNDGDSYRHQAVLDAYSRLLDLRVHLLRRIAECGLPPEAPEVVTYRRIGEQQVAVMSRLIGVVRGIPGDDDEQWQREEREHRLLARAERFGDQADQWLSFEEERRATLANITEQLVDAPAELLTATRAALDAATQAHQTAQTAFAAAAEAGDLTAALAAKHLVERARHQTDRQLMRLDEDISLVERELAWRQHAKDPAVAEKLREWEKRRGEALAARRTAEEAADAALAASQAAERAQLASEMAEEHAAALQDAADQHDLVDLMEALDEMVDLRAGTVPAQ
ncbi:MAG: hypothetical protein H0W78_07420 [Planctomycetes bacterium]|nr:hypothetical protein [Planctomycetota bacterium]